MGLNEIVKRFDIFDISLIKLSTAAVILLIAKYWTAITSLAWYWYVIAFVILAIRPLKHMMDKEL